MHTCPPTAHRSLPAGPRSSAEPLRPHCRFWVTKAPDLTTGLHCLSSLISSQKPLTLFIFGFLQDTEFVLASRPLQELLPLCISAPSPAHPQACLSLSHGSSSQTAPPGRGLLQSPHQDTTGDPGAFLTSTLCRSLSVAKFFPIVYRLFSTKVKSLLRCSSQLPKLPGQCLARSSGSPHICWLNE